MGEQFADGTKAKYALLMADGTTWITQVAQGCGTCGNPLSKWIKAGVTA